MTKALNIVSFDVPFPANYGGVIDVYYKIFWLHQAGIKIHLHCFAYGRQPSAQLEALCEKVYYYPRHKGFRYFLSTLPYTVATRKSKQLEKNLLSNSFPILFEVLHTCYLLNDDRFKNRIKVYRHSNIEHDYYSELSRTEKQFTKKYYLKLEALKLKKFEAILSKANTILAVNKKDTAYFQKKFPTVKSYYLPSFSLHEKTTIKSGLGNFALFHGNLSVSENYESANWLIDRVFSKIHFPVIIAGLNAPMFLKDKIKKYSNIQLVENPDETKMWELIHEAQVHVLYTNQPTGLKLKLLNVLFAGRHIIANTHMLSGTDIGPDSTLQIADTSEEYILKLKACEKNEFTPEMVSDRKILTKTFDNAGNAQKLIDLIL